MGGAPGTFPLSVLWPRLADMTAVVPHSARRSAAHPTAPQAWQALMRNAVTNTAELCRLLDLPEHLAAQARGAESGFPLRVPRPWLRRIRPADPADPLLAQVLPAAAETQPVPGYTEDPLGERTRCCVPGLLWKYPGRCLMVATPACAVHCRFCFRRHFPFGHAAEAPSELPAAGQRRALRARWLPALRRIRQEGSLREVILSGGDPLTLSDRLLSRLLAQLASIPHVTRLRIHTRLPVAIPERVSDGLLAVLRGTRLRALMVVHVNHPQELDQQVALALRRLVEAGLPVLSQGVLLRGVNDHLEVLAELYERLADLRVLPYYLHQLDRVAGAAHFEVPEVEGRRLIGQLRKRLPGYAVPRYVRETPGGLCKELLA